MATADSAFGDATISSLTFAHDPVAANPVSIQWADVGATATLRSNLPWNTLKNGEVSQFNGTTLNAVNFVDVNIQLGGPASHTVYVDGAKRGEIDLLGGGSNTVRIGEDNNSPVDSTFGVFHVSFGNGDNHVLFGPASKHYADPVTAKPGFGGVNQPRQEALQVSVGTGNNVVDAGTGGEQAKLVLSGREQDNVVASIVAGDEYTVTGKADKSINTVFNVQTLQFSDGTLTLPITPPTPCYGRGTRILTAMGEVAVEALAVGDLVVGLSSGGTVPVTWIGRRGVELAGHRTPDSVRPVRVIAHAFGEKRPHRDLVLSPKHAVFAMGVLVPVRLLINGQSIVQEHVDFVDYYHVELGRHDVLLAEGLPAESYLDTGNRRAFENGVAHAGLGARTAREAWSQDACAELVTDGPVLESIRQTLRYRLPAIGFAPVPLWLEADGIVMDEICTVLSDTELWDFELPGNVRQLVIRSQTTMPKPGGAECRNLGVAIGAVTIDREPCPLHSVGTEDSGWYPIESAQHRTWRWTNGAATLPVTGREVSVRLAHRATPHSRAA